MEAKLARSTAGHDCGKIYVVIREEPGSVWLADGRLKTVDKLKRKNSRHVQLIKKIPGPVAELLCGETVPTDVELKRALKLYEKSVEKERHFQGD